MRGLDYLEGILILGGDPICGAVAITSTYNASDPIAWRQMHHWGLAKGIVRMRLRSGMLVLPLRVLTKAPDELRLPAFQAGGAVAADFVKTPFHFIGIGFFSYFLGAEVLLADPELEVNESMPVGSREALGQR